MSPRLRHDRREILIQNLALLLGHRMVLHRIPGVRPRLHCACGLVECGVSGLHLTICWPVATRHWTSGDPSYTLYSVIGYLRSGVLIPVGTDCKPLRHPDEFGKRVCLHFRITWPRCILTVASLVPSWPAICLFRRPRTTSPITSCSRGLSDSYRSRVSAACACCTRVARSRSTACWTASRRS